MNINEIVGQLRAERDKLETAIRALEGIGGVSGGGRRRGRPPKTAILMAEPASEPRRGRPPSGRQSTPARRRMSAAARERIAAATKARWAAAKRSGKKRL